jgi:hypothetical protein
LVENLAGSSPTDQGGLSLGVTTYDTNTERDAVTANGAAIGSAVEMGIGLPSGAGNATLGLAGPR